MRIIAGFDKKEGRYIRRVYTEKDIWNGINQIYSSKAAHKTSYKYGLMKSILDSLDTVNVRENYRITYRQIFYMFARNYWELIVRYSIKQIRTDTRSPRSEIENIFLTYTSERKEYRGLKFECIERKHQEEIVKKVESVCKKYVIGALYRDSGDLLYDFSHANRLIYLNPAVYSFMLEYKVYLEKINYYEWAKYLEKINDGEVLERVNTKLELATKI